MDGTVVQLMRLFVRSRASVDVNYLPYIWSWAYGKEKFRGAERNVPDFFGLCPTSPEKIVCGILIAATSPPLPVAKKISVSVPF